MEPKEQMEKKHYEIEAKSLRLKIYAAESNKFTLKMTYEEIIEGIKAGRYKMTYTEKKSRA